MSQATPHPLADDLDRILEQVGPLWEALRGQRLFITGGTGFFGTWLLESFLWANAKRGLGATATVLTRDVAAARRQRATTDALDYHAGDVRDFTFPSKRYSHIIHAAATSAVATFNNEDPLIKFDTIVGGTRHVLDFTRACGARRLLYTSSGAVYGKQPPDLSHVAEDYAGAPDPTLATSAWGEAKRVAEFFCADHARRYGLEVTIARCFSFVGPHLPLDIHYAIGNFIRDALRGGPIRVLGDGTAYRSYLYAADLTIWLWTLLLSEGANGVYNVGSEQAISIGALARLVAELSAPGLLVQPGQAPTTQRLADRYIPSTQKARSELGLREWVPLWQAIEKTMTFGRHNTQSMTTQ